MKKRLFNFDFAEYNRKIPMDVFIKSLNAKDQAKIFALIEKLLDFLNFGINPPEKLSKYLVDGLFELRIALKDNPARCIYYYFEGNTILFTNGFIKNTQKTPTKEIEKALKIREYYKDKNNE